MHSKLHCGILYLLITSTSSFGSSTEVDPCSLVTNYLVTDHSSTEWVSSHLKLNATDLNLTQAKRINNPDPNVAVGAYNSGVFRVNLKGKGDVILKLAIPSAFPPHEIDQYAPLETTPEFQDYLLIHSTIASAGYGTKLHGFLLSDQASKIASSLKEKGLKVGPGPVTGILVGEIKDPWTVKHIPEITFPGMPPINNIIPPFVKEVSQKQIEKLLMRMSFIEKDLDRLQIKSDDAQFFISKDTEGNLDITLTDLDRFHFLRSRPCRNSFRLEMQSLIKDWEKTSGNTFPPEVFQTLTGYKKN